MSRFSLFAWLKVAKRGSAISRRDYLRPHRFVPRLEAMEDRTVLSTLTVLNNADSGPGSLRDTIAAASSGDTIVFAKPVHQITLTSGELMIANSVTINGPGADKLSVSGNAASRVFDIAAGFDVTISGLTATDGFALDQAGGILNQGSNLALSADVLSQNVVLGSSATDAARGGALRSLDGTLNITDCTFTGNQALGGTSTEGAALAGAIYVLNGTATISNSTFTGNQSLGSNGVTGSFPGLPQAGAIQDAFAPLTITGSTFSGNSAVGGNGGTGLQAGNTFGGAILANSAAISITSSTFSGNSAIGGNGGTGGFAGDSQGGAIGGGTTLSITGSEFDHNQAIGGSNSNSGPGQVGPQVDCAFGGAIISLPS
jgi:hypothetical protein